MSKTYGVQLVRNTGQTTHPASSACPHPATGLSPPYLTLALALDLAPAPLAMTCLCLKVLPLLLPGQARTGAEVGLPLLLAVLELEP